MAKQSSHRVDFLVACAWGNGGDQRARDDAKFSVLYSFEVADQHRRESTGVATGHEAVWAEPLVYG